MAVVDVHNVAGEKISEVELSEDIFNVAVKGSVLHDVVKMQLASKRAGTASTKTRGEVRGSTKKLFRQKGTGNARAGSKKSPLRRGGGVIFGPSPKSWGYKLPKKVRRLALKMALSSKYQDNTLKVVDDLGIDSIKTKKFVETINRLGVKKVLVVTERSNENLELSARNLPNAKVIRVEGLNVYDILKFDNLLLLQPSIDKIEGRLLK